MKMNFFLLRSAVYYVIIEIINFSEIPAMSPAVELSYVIGVIYVPPLIRVISF
jgi:hypothetical protein